MQENYISFDDAEHVRRTLHGDNSAYDTLVRQYHGMVMNIAMAHLNHNSDRSEELTQEVFLRGYLHLSALSKPKYFPAWLAQITRNLAADWQRKDRRSSVLVKMLPIDDVTLARISSPAPTPREAAASSEEELIIARAVAKLPADHREVLLLRYAEDFSPSQIARNLGIHPSSATRRLNSAIARLRSLYEGEAETAIQRLKTNETTLQRTLAVVAAVWLLPASQRSSLAAAAGRPLSFPAISGPSQVFKSTAATAAGLVVACVAIALLGLAILGSSESGSEPVNSAVLATTNMQPVSTEITAIKSVATASAISENTREARRAALRSETPDQTTGTLSNTATSAISTDVSTSLTRSSSGTELVPTGNISDASLVGNIVGPDGQPVPHLQIKYSVLTPAPPPAFTSPFPMASKVVHLSQPMQQQGQTETNASGRFVIDKRVTGTALLSIDHPPFAQALQEVTLPSESITIRLSMSGATAKGTVKSLTTGEPVPGAEVVLWPMRQVVFQDGPDNPGREFSLPGQRRIVATDENGNFVADRLPDGPFSVDASAEGLIALPTAFFSQEKPVAKVGAATDLGELFLYEGHTARGRVVDKKTGEPVPGAEVNLGYHYINGKSPHAISDNNGYYMLKGLMAKPGAGQPGDGSPSLSFGIISAQKDGYHPQTLMPREEGQFNPDDLEIELNIELTPQT